MIARNQICQWSITYSTGSCQWLGALPPEGKGKITEASAPHSAMGLNWVVDVNGWYSFFIVKIYLVLCPGLDFGAHYKVCGL